MSDRTISLIGIDAYNKIKKLNVLVIGIGGVGSYTVEALTRSGVENITIIDKDVFDITNLNRQLGATLNTINQNKCEITKNRILSINNNINVKIINELVTTKNINTLNLEEYDFIVDAIDDIKVKIELIKYCLNNKLKIISSMGTARKLHPESLEITVLSKTEYDPIARILRKELKGFNLNKIIVISSKEKPSSNAGSMMFVPSTAGILIASYIINETIK